MIISRICELRCGYWKRSSFRELASQSQSYREVGSEINVVDKRLVFESRVPGTGLFILSIIPVFTCCEPASELNLFRVVAIVVLCHLSIMPRRARLELISLRNSLVNLPISVYGPLVERQVVGVSALNDLHLRLKLIQRCSVPKASPSTSSLPAMERRRKTYRST